MEHDPHEPVPIKVARLETQMEFVLERLRAPAEIKQIVPEVKTFLGFTEDKLVKWLVMLALGLSAGGNLPMLLSNLAKAVTP